MSDNKDEPRVRGLGHMAADPQALARERQTLEALAKESAGKRFRGYFALTGPGWLQSAFTLGGGSAVASLYLGAHYGYELMWVQPLAMTVGIIMLAACAHQTLSTGVRPFAAMSRFIHPGVAWAWALATLVSSWVFHFPQYSLAAGVTEDITTLVTGWSPQGAVRTAFLLAIGVVILAVSTAITWNYGRGIRGIRLYERTLKAFIAMIIIAFGLVVARGAASGTIDWGALARGFIPTSIPSDAQGVTTVMGAFGAAVGINMTFLFGYSLLARGWGTSHRGLARFDLVTGMLLPYAVVTSLIIIAAASTIYGTEFAPQQILTDSAGQCRHAHRLERRRRIHGTCRVRARHTRHGAEHDHVADDRRGIRRLRAFRLGCARAALSLGLSRAGAGDGRRRALGNDGHLGRTAGIHDRPDHAADRLRQLVRAAEQRRTAWRAPPARRLRSPLEYRNVRRCGSYARERGLYAVDAFSIVIRNELVLHRNVAR
jgi:Mn2+/Fe2+ NRAMP family transporter